jgi:uncharacterized protein (TIGR01244 family)
VTDFRQITESFWASPQIDLADIAEAKARGFALIVNNRPEGESDDQLAGPEIEAAARAAGMDYIAIPITHAGFSEELVSAMAEALESASAPVLAYCRVVAGRGTAGARGRRHRCRCGPRRLRCRSDSISYGDAGGPSARIAARPAGSGTASSDAHEKGPGSSSLPGPIHCLTGVYYLPEPGP